MTKPILCVDFDGVIHDYASGWQGLTTVADPPTPGALQWLLRALEHWDVQIYSTRSRSPEGIEAMRDWMKKHAKNNLTEEEAVRLMDGLKFAHEKPWAFLMIDDRAIRFEGDWSKLDPQALLNFKPWNKERKWTSENEATPHSTTTERK